MRRSLVVAPLLALVSCVGAPEPVVAPAIVPQPPAFTFVETTATDPVDDRLPPPPIATAHVPKPWPFDVENYAIVLWFDPARRAISGTVTIRFAALADGLKEIPLDAVDMKIRDVTDGATPTPLIYSYDGRTLSIALPEPHVVATQRTITVAYSANPPRGIHFNDGDPPQVYTQGECEDSRYWFPCHDAPDDRATHSVHVMAPSDWRVVAGGTLSGSGALFGGIDPFPWNYEVTVPHVAYLTSMTAGKYQVVDEQGVVPLQYVVEARDAPYAAFDFRRTNDILKFLGDWTGLPYPYPKYSQTCVRDFLFGGMENISATTLADSTIHPSDWEPARSSTSLVAHEAAHQWFGDWITCSDWSHCWLNEGFATYFDALFTERDEGRDAFLWTMRGLRNGALAAMDGERRAVVSNVWAEPLELFDGHAYDGGAVRLHMLRHLLGDSQFQGAIRHYVKKCGLQCVTTDDFQHAVEEYTGQYLAWFFDQWFRKPGYPVLKVRWKWDEARKVEVVTVEQTQKAEGGVPEAYRLPLDIAFSRRIDPESETWTKRVEVTKRSETFEIALPWMPARVQPDPETALLARYDFGLAVNESAQRIFFAGNPSWRFDAAEAVAAFVKDPKNTPDHTDSPYFVLITNFQSASYGGPETRIPPFRAALAGLVACRTTDTAAATLIEAMDGDPDLRVRLAAMEALYGFEGNVKVLAAIARHLDDDHDLVRAAAVSAIAKLKHPQAFDLLTAAVERPGWQSVARVAALRGMGDYGDDRAFPTFVRFAAPGDRWARGTAIEQLGRLGRKKPEHRDALLPYLDDPNRNVRQQAASALGAVADPSTIGVLVAHFGTETSTPVKDALRGAIRACRAAAVEEGRLVSVESVRASQIRDRHAALRDEIEALEPSLKTLEGDAKTVAETKLKSLRDQLAQAHRDLDDLGVPVKPKPAPAGAAVPR